MQDINSLKNNSQVATSKQKDATSFDQSESYDGDLNQLPKPSNRGFFSHRSRRPSDEVFNDVCEDHIFKL